MSAYNRKIETRKKVAEIKSLPVLPKILESLLDLRDNPNASVIQLVDIIALDPVITAHFLKYANSAFFGAAKKINSLEDAINRIGFNVVLNMAIGISATKSFDIPKEGPIGMREYWHHALFSAHLMRLIASKVPKNHNLNPEIAFLAGLLHNIGYVLLGDQFREEFALLNNSVKTAKNKTLTELELVLVGISHTELGVMLMRFWGLPPEIVTATYEHHNPAYRGSHWEYANLVFIANYLLHEKALSDNMGFIPSKILDGLSLSESTLEQCLEKLNAQSDDLDAMVESLFNQ